MSISRLLAVVAVVAAIPFLHAHDDMSKPEILIEKSKEDPKKDRMYIDGIKVHETDPTKQPQPRVITPGAKPGQPPSDAIVLFDGTEASLANWVDDKGKPTIWKLVDGALQPASQPGYMLSKQEFGSCQLHIEWATPSEVKESGQARGNSGVFLMSHYEVQILDSYQNTTYPDGQAGAIYGRSKPLVNASRKPGEWQSYDIIFHRPLFNEKGKVTRRATFTVFHNGVLIQDHIVLSGGTGWRGEHMMSPYKAHGDKGPLELQDHGYPVRFRNIWYRPLKD